MFQFSNVGDSNDSFSFHVLTKLHMGLCSNETRARMYMGVALRSPVFLTQVSMILKHGGDFVMAGLFVLRDFVRCVLLRFELTLHVYYVFFV